MRCGQHTPAVLRLARARARQSRYDAISLAALDELDHRIVDVQRGLAVEDMGNILSGQELMEITGRAPGPWIQQVKDVLLEAQLDDPALTKDRARILARRFADENLR
jgi:hypothetical protein